MLELTDGFHLNLINDLLKQAGQINFLQEICTLLIPSNYMGRHKLKKKKWSVVKPTKEQDIIRIVNFHVLSLSLKHAVKKRNGSE